MIHEFIRLTIVVLSSDNCQTKKKQLSDESSTIVRRIIFRILRDKELRSDP